MKAFAGDREKYGTSPSPPPDRASDRLPRCTPGGEKKRNEILQLAVLEPRLAILDETDSGLDIDALKVVAAGVNAFRSPERAIVVVTHYQRLLNHIVPDFVHVLVEGRIVRSGGRELALGLEERGYGRVQAPGAEGGEEARP